MNFDYSSKSATITRDYKFHLLKVYTCLPPPPAIQQDISPSTYCCKTLALFPGILATDTRRDWHSRSHDKLKDTGTESITLSQIPLLIPPPHIIKAVLINLNRYTEWLRASPPTIQNLKTDSLAGLEQAVGCVKEQDIRLIKKTSIPTDLVFR